MRKFLTSGRRRYALAFVVVGASLGVMGAQCQPAKTPAPPKPPPTGLSISPGLGDFGSQGVNAGPTNAIRFTVTNNGPGSTGILAAGVVPGPSQTEFNIVPATNTCNAPLANGASCVVDVNFDPTVVGGNLTNLRVDDPSNGEVTAILGGVGTS
jgi:hypothetical protein